MTECVAITQPFFPPKWSVRDVMAPPRRYFGSSERRAPDNSTFCELNAAENSSRQPLGWHNTTPPWWIMAVAERQNKTKKKLAPADKRCIFMFCFSEQRIWMSGWISGANSSVSAPYHLLGVQIQIQGVRWSLNRWRGLYWEGRLKSSLPWKKWINKTIKLCLNKPLTLKFNHQNLGFI